MSDRETPYTADETRVCDYLREITNDAVGCGDDPIGFLIASHRIVNLQRTQIAAAARACILDTRTADGSGSVDFMQGGHRRIRLADALKAVGL